MQQNELFQKDPNGLAPHSKLSPVDGDMELLHRQVLYTKKGTDYDSHCSGVGIWSNGKSILFTYAT